MVLQKKYGGFNILFNVIVRKALNKQTNTLQ